jgi:hypothetical protein
MQTLMLLRSPDLPDRSTGSDMRAARGGYELRRAWYAC